MDLAKGPQTVQGMHLQKAFEEKGERGPLRHKIRSENQRYKPQPSILSFCSIVYILPAESMFLLERLW